MDDELFIVETVLTQPYDMREPAMIALPKACESLLFLPQGQVGAVSFITVGAGQVGRSVSIA